MKGIQRKVSAYQNLLEGCMYAMFFLKGNFTPFPLGHPLRSLEEA